MILVAVLTFWLTTRPSQASVQFLVEPEDEVVARGSDVRWQCEALNPFNPHANISYSWWFMSLLVTRGPRHTLSPRGDVLTLRDVTNADFGVYQCKATDGTTESFSRHATLSRAYIAPSFKLHPRASFTHAGDEIQLSCEINSLPPALLSWQRDNKPVSHGEVTTVNRQRSLLTLDDVSDVDAGEYRCRAVNVVLSEVRYSDVARIELEGKPRFITAPSPLTVSAGRTAELMCSSQGYPDPNIEWLDARNPDNQRPFTTGGKYVVSNTSLRIMNAHQADSGFYTCRASNSWGQASKTVLLTVLGTSERPRFITMPGDTTVMEGETVTWSCSATGRPPPIITWGKVEGILPEGRTELPYPGTVKLHDVGKSDAGSYLCRAAVSDDVITHIWSLTVQVGPTFDVLPVDVALNSGTILSLPCQASGVPEPVLAWKIPNGVEVPVPGSSRAQKLMTLSNGTLIIADVREGDAGRYTCIARNVVSTRSASAAVYVYYGPLFTTSPSNTLVTEGNDAMLHCAGKGFPLPTVTWYGPLANHTLRTGEDLRLLANGSLVIYSVQKAQEGRYTCVLDNGVNQMIVSAELKIIVRPFFTSEASSVVVSEDSDLWLHCVARGTPDPTLEWNRHNKLLLLEDNMIIHPNGTLYIYRIRRSQFGNYVCVATNAAGRSEQISTVWRDDVPVITRPPQNTTGNASSVASFSCVAVAHSPPVISWFRIDHLGRVLTQITRAVLGGRGYITEEGSLVFQELRGDDEGWYVCVAKNVHGNDSHKAYLDVKVKPRVESSPIPVIAENGSPTTLLCQVQSDPTPTLSWQPPRSNDVIRTTSRDYGLQGNTLVIRTASVRRDAGSWRCQACNYLGCHHGYIRLNVQGPPVLVSADTYASLPQNLTKIKCLAVGTPVPEVTYFWGQLEVNPRSPPPGLGIGEGNWLEIAGPPQPPYTCMARNLHGRDMRPLSVPFPPKDLQVTNVTSSSLVLTWSLDGFTLLPSSYVIIHVMMPDITGSNNQDVIVPMTTDGRAAYTHMTYTLDTLQAHTTYGLQVAAHNVLGDSEKSSLTTVTTGEAAPTPPRDVRAVLDRGTLLATWKEPLQMNGRREHVQYEIEYHNSPSETSLTLIHNATLVPEVTFRDVKYGDTVNIQVTAINTVINQRSSPTHILLILNEKPPSGSPADVFVETSRSGSIYVEWKAPPAGSGSVVGYMVAVGQSQKFTVFRLDSSKTLNFKVSSLTPGDYNVKVAAYNYGGVGPYSSIVGATVQPDTGPVGASTLGRTEVVGIVAGCVAVVFIVLLILLACCHYHKHRRSLLEKDIDAIYQQKEAHLYDNKGYTVDTIGSQKSGGRSYYDAISITKEVGGVTPSVTPVISHHRMKPPRLGLAPDVVLVTEHPSRHTSYTSPSISHSNRLGAADFELAELTYGHSPMPSHHAKAFRVPRGSLQSDEIYAELDLAHRGALNQIYADIHSARSTGSQDLLRSRSLSRSRTSIGSQLGLLPEESTSENTEPPSSEEREISSSSLNGGRPQPKPIYSVPVRNGKTRPTSSQTRPLTTDYETKVSRMDFDSESSGEAEPSLKPAIKSSATSRFNSDVTFWQTTNEHSAELF